MSQITLRCRVKWIHRDAEPLPCASVQYESENFVNQSIMFESGKIPADWVEGQAVEIIIRSVTP